MRKSADDEALDVVRAPDVFVLLPVLNEVSNIGPLLDGIDQALPDRSVLVGILDDGSTDGTVEYVRDRAQAAPGRIHLIERKKLGPGCQRGSAILELLRWGLLHTRAPYFVEMDGDLSHRPEELPEGLRRVAEAGFDVAIASKYLSGSREVERHPVRRLVSFVCCQAARALLDRRITDYSNGYRFYTRRSAEVIARHEVRNGGPTYLIEVLALWLREGLRITEFPSVYVGRQRGTSKVVFHDVVRSAVALLSIAARYRMLGFHGAPAWTGAGGESDVASPSMATPPTIRRTRNS